MYVSIDSLSVICPDVEMCSTELALGALAAAFAQLFTIPVSVIATRQQLSNTSTTFLSTLRDILADDGITGLWRGLKPSLVLTINPAITYGMFERLKTGLLKEGEKMTPGKAFVLGALSKTMATVVRISSCLRAIATSSSMPTDPRDVRSPIRTFSPRLDFRRNSPSTLSTLPPLPAASYEPRKSTLELSMYCDRFTPKRDSVDGTKLVFSPTLVVLY